MRYVNLSFGGLSLNLLNKRKVRIFCRECFTQVVRPGDILPVKLNICSAKIKYCLCWQLKLLVTYLLVLCTPRYIPLALHVVVSTPAPSLSSLGPSFYRLTKLFILTYIRVLAVGSSLIHVGRSSKNKNKTLRYNFFLSTYYHWFHCTAARQGTNGEIRKGAICILMHIHVGKGGTVIKRDKKILL